MPHKSAIIMILGVLSTALACAQAPVRPELRRGTDLQSVTLEAVASEIRPGTVLVVGENHDNAVHSGQQIQLLQALKAEALKLNVGMEFLTYTDQPVVDLYLQQSLTEAEFLKAVGWKGSNYPYYREQILFPRQTEGKTFALNSPRTLSSKIAKSGLASLSPEEAALLPPQFTPGNAGYFARFKAAMGAHLPGEEALERYFLAQSLWDDTMAWRAELALKENPSHVLVIIVGEFHVQYGGGLPDRLRARGVSSIKTVSQLNVLGLSPSEVEAELKADGPYGPRADYLWISSF